MIFPLRDNNPSQRIPLVTWLIIAINTAVLVWMSTLPAQEQNRIAYERGFIPQRIAQLTDHRVYQIPIELSSAVPNEPPRIGLIEFQPVRSEIYLSLLTAIFLHGGWMHLIGNMWFLWVFGDNVEGRLGHVAFAVLYLVGGVLANLCHWYMQPHSLVPVIGASGAVAAVLGAYVITWPFARIHSVVFVVLIFFVELPALVVLGLWFAMQLLQARAVDHRMDSQGVAWWAHVGGFLAGMALMSILSFWSFPDPRHGDPTAEAGEPTDDSPLS